MEEQQEGPVSLSDTKTAESPDKSLETNQMSGSGEESVLGIIADIDLGPDTNTDCDSSSSSDVDPDPNPEPEAGSNSTEAVPNQLLDQLMEGTDVKGDCSAKP